MTDTAKNKLSFPRRETPNLNRTLKRLMSDSMPLDPKGDGNRLGRRLGEAFRKDLEQLKLAK